MADAKTVSDKFLAVELDVVETGWGQKYWQKEQLMNEVSHPNLPKPIHLDPDLLSSLRHEFKGDLILYPSAQTNLLAFV